jgi:hypothetical protein
MDQQTNTKQSLEARVPNEDRIVVVVADFRVLVNNKTVLQGQQETSLSKIADRLEADVASIVGAPLKLTFIMKKITSCHLLLCGSVECRSPPSLILDSGLAT